MEIHLIDFPRRQKVEQENDMIRFEKSSVEIGREGTRETRRNQKYRLTWFFLLNLADQSFRL
jgi:hypothetical protein